MPEELTRLPPALAAALAGEAFRRRRRLVLLLATADPDGFPRVALLTMGEVRTLSDTRLAVAVRARSRTAINLVRRATATLVYLNRGLTASVQARAGRGRVCLADPLRRLFPMRVERVRVDRPHPSEGDVELLTGPTFTGAGAPTLFSDELFAELGEAAAAG
jgi:Pyridoxamine 5'-phosphate oxidase